MAEVLRRVPVWAWLVVLVLASFAVRAWLARDMLGAFIMVDELIYSELGRSIADSRELLVRDVPSPGYGIVYPALLSPAYAAFDSLPEAYAAVKTLNSLVMSLAAIPAFFLARRVVGPWLSLFAAVLAVSIPSLVYTGTVMTENVFYPVFLTVALVFVLTLERPTAARQVLLLAGIGLAFATRAQSVALVPAVLSAPLLLAVFRREGWRTTLRPFRWLYAAVVGGGLVVAAVQLARGRSLSDLFGAYSVVGDSEYDVLEVLRYFVYHLAELDLYLGIVPVAATIVLVARGRTARRAAPGAARGRADDDVLARARGVGVRVGLRAADPGAEHVRRRAALPRPAAGVGRSRCAPAAGALAARGRGSSAARARDPVRALHRDVRALGHAHAAAVVERAGSRDARMGCGARAAPRGRARRRLRPRAAALCPRPAAARARVLRSGLPPDLGGEARRAPGLGGCGLPGHPRRASRLDRHRASGRRSRGGALDRPRRPLHGEPERVLQPRRGRRVLHAAADSRRCRRDARAHRPGGRLRPSLER